MPIKKEIASLSVNSAKRKEVSRRCRRSPLKVTYDGLLISFARNDEGIMRTAQLFFSEVFEPLFYLLLAAHFSGNVVNFIGRLVFLFYVMVFIVMRVLIVLAMAKRFPVERGIL